MEETEHYEVEINALTREDFADAGPVEVTGQDYAIVGGEIVTQQVYLVDVVVRLAGGGGAALVLNTDYTVDKRTGIVSIVGGGALDGQTDAWIELSYDGISNVPLRQLANRAAWLKAQMDAAFALVPGLTGEQELALNTFGVPFESTFDGATNWEKDQFGVYCWDQENISTGLVLELPLPDFPKKGRLKKISVFFEGLSHTALPANMPSFQLLGLRPSNAGAAYGSSVVTDPSASTGEYEPLHEVSLDLDVAIQADVLYRLKLTGESGANAQTGLRFYGCTVTVAHE